MICQCTTLDSVIICIASIQNEFEVKDTIDTHIEIDNGGILKTKLYHKCDDFTFTIVNFPFIGSNIPTSPAYSVFTTHALS